MKTKKKTTVKRLTTVALAILSLALVLLAPLLGIFAKDGGRYSTNTVRASAASLDYIKIESYGVTMRVNENRNINVEEIITVTFLRKGLTMFYRSLPTSGARYKDFEATCVGNDEFHYYVADNPDMEGFIDVNCVGNATQGTTWTYAISYEMQQATSKMKDGMMLDVVGFGWTVPLHNVTATVMLPEKPTESEVYSDVFGSSSKNAVDTVWSEDGKTVVMTAEKLELIYSERYDEMVAGGITLEFVLPKGVLKSYASTRIFTEDMWKIILVTVLFLAGAVVASILLKSHRELVTTVSVKAPDGIDPMKMGKWLDGAVNTEDITSMVYYFANQGYLRIDLTDENDPLLITWLESLPAGVPEHQKTLFNGLFEHADREGGCRQARISEIAGKFYEESQTATQQVPDAPKMYAKKSIFAYLLGGIMGVALAFFVPFFMSMRLGGDYTYPLGIILVFPIIFILILGYFTENYRYKWKKKARIGMWVARLAIAVFFSLIFIFLFGEHIMTGYEKLVLCIGVFGCVSITQNSLERSEEYLSVLGKILGFKEFIVVTEEEKIAFMLEEDPELYYKVLPYAQVLGVTDEWEGKFKGLLMQPPSWYSSSSPSAVDCLIMHHCIRRSMLNAMIRAAQAAANRGGGGHIGRSGGGGSFGGFGGGGFGGGGGGAR